MGSDIPGMQGQGAALSGVVEGGGGAKGGLGVMGSGLPLCRAVGKTVALGRGGGKTTAPWGGRGGERACVRACVRAR